MPPQKRSRKPAKPPADPDPLPVEVDTFGRFEVAAPASTTDLAGYYGRLVTTSRIRVEMLSNLLADDYTRRGIDALRRVTYVATADGGTEPAGEVPTALARLEMEERRTLERLIVKAAELGIKLRGAESEEQHWAETIAVMVAFAERSGMDQLEPDVRRNMQLAVLAVRQAREITQRR